jgi:hypothetical protein
MIKRAHRIEFARPGNKPGKSVRKKYGSKCKRPAGK